MAKIVKTRKRKLRFEVASFLILVVMMVATVFSNLFVGSMKASLMIEIQKMNSQSENLISQNQKLNIEIQTLQNKDRVYTIAQDAGLKQNQDNIISVNDGE